MAAVSTPSVRTTKEVTVARVVKGIQGMASHAIVRNDLTENDNNYSKIYQ